MLKLLGIIKEARKLKSIVKDADIEDISLDGFDKVKHKLGDLNKDGVRDEKDLEILIKKLNKLQWESVLKLLAVAVILIGTAYVFGLI